MFNIMATSCLERIGLTARDLIVIILILVNMTLILTGHAKLDSDFTKVSASMAQSCGVVTR